MVIDGETVIARCSFGQGNRHTAFLTRDALLIQRKNHPVQRYNRETIKNLSVGHRYLWLPLVVGGILTPFAIIALIKTSGAFWFLFILALTGAFLLYYGYSGTDTFTISTPVKDYDYFIDQNKPHLKAFIQFVRGQLLNRDPFLYVSANTSQYTAWKALGHVPSGTEIFLRKYDMPPSDIVLFINPQEQDTPLDFRVPDDFSDARSFLRFDMEMSLFQQSE